jgi:xanthine dehydrogenase accessory factor
MVIVIRGGGDLASGVAVRLSRSGFKVAITELPQPLVVRRTVSFAEAIFQGSVTIEGVTGKYTRGPQETKQVLQSGQVPVLVDPNAQALVILKPQVLIDGRMTKRPPDLGMNVAPLVIGLGPGFIAGVNCHAAIETNRGHAMGRVLWQGSPESDTGVPEMVADRRAERVLRAPADGILKAYAEIGDHIEEGQKVAEVDGRPVLAPFKGVLRGLIRSGFTVKMGLKIGDLDPRDDPLYTTMVSDKSLAVAGGVLEAILSRADLRPYLWS